MKLTFISIGALIGPLCSNRVAVWRANDIIHHTSYITHNAGNTSPGGGSDQIINNHCSN